jgi:hypothetical protein
LKLKIHYVLSSFEDFGPPSGLSISDPAPVFCWLEKEIDILFRGTTLNRIV